jgi:hypothetical protein
MGSRSYRVAVGRSFAVDAVSLLARQGHQGEPRGGAGAGAGRIARPRRRARRRVRTPPLHRARRRPPRRRDHDGRHQRREPAAGRKTEPLLRMSVVQRLSRAGGRNDRSVRGDCLARRARPSHPGARSRRGDFALCRPYRVRGQRRPGSDDRRARRDLARELSGAAQAAPHRPGRHDPAPRLVFPRASHRPAARGGGVVGLERDYRYRVPRPVAVADKQAGQLP